MTKTKKVNPKVVDVEPKKDGILQVFFDTYEVREFDARPYMKDAFSELKESNYFKKVDLDRNWSVCWPNEESFSDETLFAESKQVKEFDAIAFKRTFQRQFDEKYSNEDGSINEEKLMKDMEATKKKHPKYFKNDGNESS